MNGPILKWIVAGGLGATVLVVEDDPSVRQMLSEMVEHLGYQVLQASNGPEALSQCAAHPQIELMIADVILPGGMSGVELITEAQQRGLALKSMLVSAFDRQEVQSRSGFERPIPLLRKPFSLEDLREEITRLFHSGTA